MSYRYYSCSSCMEGIFKATTMISDPNNMYRIVWAIGEYFLLIIHVSFLFLTVYQIDSMMGPRAQDVDAS